MKRRFLEGRTLTNGIDVNGPIAGQLINSFAQCQILMETILAAFCRDADRLRMMSAYITDGLTVREMIFYNGLVVKYVPIIEDGEYTIGCELRGYPIWVVEEFHPDTNWSDYFYHCFVREEVEKFYTKLCQMSTISFQEISQRLTSFEYVLDEIEARTQSV